jgi:hypothetical protein
MKINIANLKTKECLNPDIWDDDRLRPEVRKKLLKIAKDFYNDLGIPWVKVKDITFTGSLANYNWSKHSDIDLHIVIDYDDVGDKEKLVEEYFKARKNLWNKIHDIEIHNFDVEVYVQNESEPHHSTGVYSIMDNKWIVKPEQKNPIIPKESLKEKIELILKMFNIVKKLSKTENYNDTIEEAELLNKKIKKMRKCGLENGGEFSVENLTFKALRQNGLLDKLQKIKLSAYDKMMSI